MPKFFQRLLSLLKLHWFEILVVSSCVLFSAFLMLSTFGYKDNTIVLSLHIWSDFWANIPLIRSFSHGGNFPPEYPIFPGERIRYHFLFFLLVGLLERAGLRIDIAINILSIIGMSGVLIGIYWLAKKITQSKIGGALGILFFCFNSSLSWIYYLFGKSNFIENPIGLLSVKTMATHGPYDDHIVGAFWKLNVFTNQRHFALSLAILFFSFWAIIYSGKKKWLLTGVFFLGLLSWMHKAVLLIALIQLGIFFVGKKDHRRNILGAIFLVIGLSIPGIKYLNGTGIHTEQAITWQPGFLYNSTNWNEFASTTFQPFLRWVIYWILNWGILPLTAILGWLSIINNKLKIKNQITHNSQLITHYSFSDESLWFAGGVSLFIISNLFSFAGDIATNHKFLNYTQIIFGIFSAGLIVNTWKNWTLKPFLVFICFIVMLGGLFDILPLIHDEKYYWQDIPQDEVAQWIEKNTPSNSVFLNTSYTTNSVTITGRKILWGWDYFTGSIGYDLQARKELLRPIIGGVRSFEETCKTLRALNTDYILLNKSNDSEFLDVTVDNEFFTENFQVLVHFPQLSIYDVEHSCQSLDLQ